MNKSDSIAKLAPALVKAQAEIKAAQKSGDNKFDKYHYSKLEDFLDVAKPVIAKHGFAIVIGTPLVMALPDRTTKSGGAEHACQVQVAVTLVHESGEWIEIVGHGEGQDRADKSIYKAITGAKKYAVAGLLSIPTTDDPEADEAVGTDTKKKTTSTGEPAQKIPKWSKEQTSEAAAISSDVLKMLEDCYKEPEHSGKPLEMLREFRSKHKYDDPSLFIDELAKWKNQLVADMMQE